MNVTVFGTGYVGLVQGAVLADVGATLIVTLNGMRLLRAR